MTSVSMLTSGWPENVIQKMNRAAIHPDALARGMTIDDVKKGDAATCIVHVGVAYWCAKCDDAPAWVSRPVPLGDVHAFEAWGTNLTERLATGRSQNLTDELQDVVDRGESAVLRRMSCTSCGTTLHDVIQKSTVVRREASRDQAVMTESAFGDIRLARGPATVVAVERERRGGLSRVRVELEWPEGMTLGIDNNPLPYIENYSVRRPLQSLHRGGPANVRNYERCTLLIGAREQRDPVFTEARQKYDARNGLFD